MRPYIHIRHGASRLGQIRWSWRQTRCSLLKNNSYDLCSNTKPWKTWSVLEPSTVVQLAAMAGFSCMDRTSGHQTLWHSTQGVRRFHYPKSRGHARNGGTVEVLPPAAEAKKGSPHITAKQHHSSFKNSGEFADTLDAGVLLRRLGGFGGTVYTGPN